MRRPHLCRVFPQSRESMIPKSETGFGKRSCLKKVLERDDGKKSHPVLIDASVARPDRTAEVAPVGSLLSLAIPFTPFDLLALARLFLRRRRRSSRCWHS